MLKKKIVLVDDPEVRGVLEASFLHRAGFSLQTVTSGLQAITAIEDDDPPLAILSLEMADLAGDACCRQIKADPLLRPTRVLLLAPGAGAQALERCRAAGADAILAAPFRKSELLGEVCALLNIVHRAGPRLPVRLVLRCGPAPIDLRAGCATDLGSGGLFVETAKLLPVNSRVHLEFSLPEGAAPLQVQGRVAWVNHPEWIKKPSLAPGMGIEFCDLSAEARVAIEAFVAARLSADGEEIP